MLFITRSSSPSSCKAATLPVATDSSGPQRQHLAAQDSFHSDSTGKAPGNLYMTNILWFPVLCCWRSLLNFRLGRHTLPNEMQEAAHVMRMGSHALPVEQGRLAKPAVPRHLRRCTLCGTRALGDETAFCF